MNILERTVQNTPENELLIRGLQEYLSAHDEFINALSDFTQGVAVLNKTIEIL